MALIKGGASQLSAGSCGSRTSGYSGSGSRILGDLLTSWRLRVSTAADAEAGLAALEQAHASGEAFELVLLDAVLPGMSGLELAERVQADASLRGVPVILLSSGQPVFRGRLATLGIRRILTKPAKQSKLRQAILEALGSEPARPTAPEPAVTAQRRRVLVAEDDPVNQRVVGDMLRQRGHEPVIVGTGAAALQQLQREADAFDLVLMDVRMPEMSGLEATRRYRHHEREVLDTDTHIPIVAMTAHAMKGDRELCLAAGMDDYLAKPLRAQSLYAMVERFPVRHPPPQTTAQTTATSANEPGTPRDRGASSQR
jgi:two-component system, sensor histidine kinase and response regulator